MTKEEADLIIAEQNKSKEEILKAVAKVKSDYHEICKLKDMRIAELEYQLTHRNCVDCSNHSSKLRMRTLELETQIEKMKCCENCKYHSYWGNEVHCDYGLKEALQEDILIECKDMDKWELEND